MAKTFKDFLLLTPTTIADGDFVVGYKADGSSEWQMTRADFVKAVTGAGLALKSPGIVTQLLTAPTTNTGSTAEVPAFAFNIPAQFLIPGMRFRCWVPGGRVSGTAGFWLANFYINNVKVGASNHSTTVASESPVWEFFVQSATTIIALPGQDGVVNNSALPVAITINPANPVPIKITMTNSVAADSTVSLGYSLEAIPT